jgi:hypothetical protein
LKEHRLELQKINPQIPVELERWAGQLGVSVEVLKAAIEAIGTDVDKIKAHLSDPTVHAGEG